MLVVYKSRYGAVERYAKWIAEKLECEAMPVSQVKTATLLEYRMLIFGGGLYTVSYTHLIKAQAVATYTLLYKRNQNGNYPTGLSMGTPSSTVKQAVKEVWGEALYAGGRLMDVFYFSISAGRTNEPQEV